MYTSLISPFNYHSKNRLAADHPTAALGHTGVETHISVNAARVACLPTHVLLSPPLLVVPNLGTTNDVGGMAAVAASVA